MKLGYLLEGMNDYDLTGPPEQEISGVAYDSRQVKPGYLFVALRGTRVDGHDYVKNAISRGAAAVVAEEHRGSWENSVVVRVSDTREALWKIGVRFYNSPFKGMDLVGITGTNGKTTTSFLLESILMAAGGQPGVVGTVNYRFAGKTFPASVTTPESLDLLGLLRKMADARVTHVVMEVSSHALDQKRTGDCPFRVGLFTNFSRDHLDYHRTMEEYFKAKTLLFKGLNGTGAHPDTTAVINLDDPRGEELVAMTSARVVTYGLGQTCQVRACDVVPDMGGIQARLLTPWGERTIRSPLIGEVNIYNIMAASAAALSLGIGLDEVVEGVERLRRVPGRLEMVENNRNLHVVVDYAHTPDALLKTIEALKSLVKGRVITVFGCGGDRDKGKRSEMGRIAGRHSDLVFITSDNPRTEDPGAIISQIEQGVGASGLTLLKDLQEPHMGTRGYIKEADRRKAILGAVGAAREGDLVLIAGKGHEDYQIVGRDRKHFDDREEAALAASA
ncbi:MAG: UDP-N-acetylmuramoyl-L-alanyl-D-glutamate--2,6-diaminopimelate ligase [Deltaproteobacteria bacterium]|nr:UDP-N-acetylmuramoyl-L-alanyl-D-glutamate--2,6-diaminopimelate ligase [Deltaproteobacteria bacterium]